MKTLTYIIICITLAACNKNSFVKISTQQNDGKISGSSFYEQTLKYNWKQRDSVAVEKILQGNVPTFFKKFVAVNSSYTDSLGKKHTAIFFVSQDYVSLGSNNDWVRIPLTPMAAQKIADSFHCFLPTKKMVDLIYMQSKIKLQPMPMYIYRDSTITMWQHHLIIEGQRKNKKGLIAGIKKDIIITSKIFENTSLNKVAIYGWHQLNENPIQPVYTKHANWYVDYSHGVRLIYETIIVDGKKMFYADVLQHPIFKNLICDEANCNFWRYTY